MPSPLGKVKGDVLVSKEDGQVERYDRNLYSDVCCRESAEGKLSPSPVMLKLGAPD